jgi:hypothetical protein
MRRPKRKLAQVEKAEKRRRRRQYVTILINGKQKRVKRPPTIDGMDVDEFVQRNADPLWLHQNEMWDYIEPVPWEVWPLDSDAGSVDEESADEERRESDDDCFDDIPF